MANTTGQTLKTTRLVRGKTLAQVAGRAGITPGYLSMIERGLRAVDKRSLVLALADALEIAPTELADEMVTGHGNLPQDRNLTAVRQAITAVMLDSPGGNVVPVADLRTRVRTVLAKQQACEHDFVGTALPSLIRDIHTSLAAGRDTAEILRLIVELHLQGTHAWIPVAGGSSDLAMQAVNLQRQAAERLDEPLSHGLTAFGVAHELIATGDLDLAEKKLFEHVPGTSDQQSIIVTGMLTLTHSMLAVARGNDGARLAPLDEAAQLAERVEGADKWFGFGPANVRLWRMQVALEAGDYSGAATIAAQVNPHSLPSPFRQSAYWVSYGRAMAKLPKQRNKAVALLARAEEISPARVHRHPLARETLAELLARAKHDAVGRELRAMAYRAGLPV